jgi:putative cardiolipin synthase
LRCSLTSTASITACHNKLFVVDGALAVVGGRNLADEYFLRNPRGNFFDVDVLIVGALVPELAAWFDRYWNSEQAYDLRTIVAATHSVQDEAADLGSDFERVTRPASAPPAPPAADEFGAPPLRVQLATGDFRLLHVAAASVHADPPEKAAPGVPHEMQETLAIASSTASSRCSTRCSSSRRTSSPTRKPAPRCAACARATSACT